MIKLAGAQIFTKIGLNNEALIEQLIDTVKVTIERNINSNFPNTIVHALFLLGYCFNNSNLEAMKNYKVAKPFPMASENNQASGPVSFFEEILNISFSVLKANLDSAYEFALIHNVGLALHADPQSTLMHLEKSGLLQGFMQLWFKKHPKCPTIRIRKASFLAFLQLLKLDNSVLEKLGIDFKQLSGYIAKDVPILADEEVRLLSKDDKDLWEDDECYDDMDFGFDDPKFNLDKAIADTHKDLDNLKRKVDGKDEIEDGDGDDESEDEWEDEDGEEGQHETAKEERDEDQDDENAKYSLKEIDLAPDILDNLDAVNSVLSFETQFQNMAANNTQLFSLIQSHIKDEDKSHIQESLKKLKEAIAAKTQSA